MRRRFLARVRRLTLYALMAMLFLYLATPLLWAVSSSLKSPAELFATPVVYWPEKPHWSNYAAVFRQQRFGMNLRNSAIVAAGTTLLALVVGGLAGYAIARHTFRGRQVISYAILAISMFPQISILGGLFVLIAFLKLHNTLLGLMLANTILTLPFTVWVLASFARQLPRSLEEAAVVDGATPLQTLWHVVLPLMAPGLVTAGLLAFICAWNEFLFALTFTANDSARTVPVAIALFSGASQHESPWGIVMAASVIVTLPLIVLVAFFQRRIIAGLTAGAVKG